ncbi:FAD/NAD(P)-binding protein [Amycolatopsis minnesotensis]|uniref:FAD/NAD(P)-binding protein n=1 Tax=Amycolatopsis minnesotensis TaxID=337894 RepID=A0ABN2RSI6_9PSEU
MALVGAGASGTLAAVHLLRAAATGRRPMRLTLVDRTGEFGPGLAYRTGDPRHLLNTPAGKMSAFDDDPGHFVRWSRARGHDADDGAFLPRGDYGTYLAETLRSEERRAVEFAEVRRVTDTVTGLAPHEEGVTIRLSRGAPLRADTAVLATGAGGGDPLSRLLPGHTSRYVADPWTGDGIAGVADGSPVLVLGTGLSMMDIAASITDANPRTVVHAVSRHGLVPRPHAPGAPAPAGLPEPPRSAASVGDLLRYARRSLADDPGRWREFVDRMRPHTPRLWRQLAVPERRRFLDRVNRYWDVHRHRAAPTTHDHVRALIRAGRLVVRPATVDRLRPNENGFEVDLTTPSGHRSLPVGWVVNATGFRTAGDRPDPLVRGLFETGAARPDPVGLGVATGVDGRVLGRDGRPRPVYVLGALRRGEVFESTAVPEIRAQAAALAGAALGG